jgi:hypothetical protein
VGLSKDLAPRHPGIRQPEALAPPPAVRGTDPDFGERRIRTLRFDQVVEVERLGEPERNPARDAAAKRRIVQPRLAPAGIERQGRFEKSEDRFVGGVAGAGEIGGCRLRPLSELGRAAAGRVRDRRPLLLADRLDVFGLEVEELGAEPRRGELGIGFPRELAEQQGLDRPGLLAQGCDFFGSRR